MAGETAPLSCARISNSHWRKYYYRDLYRRGAAKVQTSVHVAWINHCIARSALLFSNRPWQCIGRFHRPFSNERRDFVELAEQDVEARDVYAGRRFCYCQPPPSALYSWTRLRNSSPRAAASVSSAP